MNSNDAAPTPAWLRESCPAWCTADHHGQVIPGARIHTGTLHVVPVILQDYRHHPGQEPAPVMEAAEVVIAVSRQVGNRETWVAIGAERDRLEVTAESARRLWDALGKIGRDLDLPGIGSEQP